MAELLVLLFFFTFEKDRHKEGQAGLLLLAVRGSLLADKQPMPHEFINSSRSRPSDSDPKPRTLSASHAT